MREVPRFRNPEHFPLLWRLAMVTKLFSRTALHEHAEPAQRILGVAELPPESDDLVLLLAADPAPEVRSAAAARCADLAALGAAWKSESDDGVRDAIASSMAQALANTPDAARARACLDADECVDSIRRAVALGAADAEIRRVAVAALRGEDALVDVAQGAAHAETRIAAAERVTTPAALARLAEGAKNKDHGVARIARQRLDALADRQAQAEKADAILSQLEELAAKPGPILSAVVELNRRWQALDVSADAERLARCDAARARLQARFDRENEEQRARARLERSVREWLDALVAPADGEALAAQAQALAALREEARQAGDDAALSRLAEAAEKLERWRADLAAVAGAEVLVVEAETLAAGTSIDNAKLPERWQALDRAIRTPALTRRFEAALMLIEQRRLAQVQAAQQEASAARNQIHALLHTAEQALAAGQLQAARAAADEIRSRRDDAGLLPKPTVQRLSRLVQQLTELERWESFGQRTARLQLCDRAEALAAQPVDPPHLAREVQKLRNEWKALDAQHAGVPKALWERFDRACEKAYAPAARHFAEQAAQRKQARTQREEFIAAAAAHAPTLLAEPRDYRAIERWVRETDHAWREGALGSVEPGMWKKLDARLKAAVAPARDALSAAREKAKEARAQLIAEATALAPKAMDRDAPAQIKAIQARWQEEARRMTLAQRDERALWDQFRAACDAIFTARDAKRREADERKSENRRALEALCAQMEQLAHAGETSEQDLRRHARELQEQWKVQGGRPEPGMPALESRFRNARTAVDAALAARARSREAAVWETLAAKERLCEALDARVRSGGNGAVPDEWAALPPLPPAWERKLARRRDAALEALANPEATQRHVRLMDGAQATRRDLLLELEMALGLASPAELQPNRLALQVEQLRNRFQNAAKANAPSPAERLVAWCAEPGVAEAADRARFDRILAGAARLR
jgi:hypothetical protein